MTLAAAAELELPEFSDLAFDWFADHLPDDLGPLRITESEDPSSIVGFISFDDGHGFAAAREALVEFVVDRALPELTEWMQRGARTWDFAARVEVAKARNR